MPSVSKAQQHYFGAIKGGEIPRPNGMSARVVDEFARTKTSGLPQHKADGEASRMTNAGFQQSQTVRSVPGSRPAWMEKLTVSKMPTHLADGWASAAFGSNKGGLHRATGTPEGKPIPVYRVRRAAKSKDSHIQHMAQAAMNINPGRYR